MGPIRCNTHIVVYIHILCVFSYILLKKIYPQVAHYRSSKAMPPCGVNLPAFRSAIRNSLCQGSKGKGCSSVIFMNNLRVRPATDASEKGRMVEPHFNNLEITYIFQMSGVYILIPGIYTATKRVEYISVIVCI